MLGRGGLHAAAITGGHPGVVHDSLVIRARIAAPPPRFKQIMFGKGWQQDPSKDD